jgi:hypothetical protein
MSGVSGSSLVCWPPLYWARSVFDSRSAAGREECAEHASDTLDHSELCGPGAVGLRVDDRPDTDAREERGVWLLPFLLAPLPTLIALILFLQHRMKAE